MLMTSHANDRHPFCRFQIVLEFEILQFHHPLVDINNINVPGQKICSHFLVQIPRADAEIVTNKLPLFFLLFFY
jgi:hypothetical protein